MEHKPIQSSNIQSAGFEDGVLEVKFRSGKTYQYQDPTGEVHAGLIKAKSAGKFMHAAKGKLVYREKGEKDWRK
jgi:hypothetical protein